LVGGSARVTTTRARAGGEATTTTAETEGRHKTALTISDAGRACGRGGE